jgi:hypothetical protein
MNKALIEALINANNTNRLVDSASHTCPKSWIEAMDIQEKVLFEMGETIGAWKVGIGETPEGVMSAPLKKRSFRQGRFIEQDLPALGVQGFEVEVAFFISPEGQIKYMAPAIEWVQSRFMGWPNVKAEFQWADSLNHGGLWVGLPLVINEDLDWMNLEIMVQQDNQRKSVIKGRNPAGDPRGLLAGFIRQGKNRRSSSDVSGWVTTGSYVGLLPVEINQTVPILLEVAIQGVGSIEGKINWIK